MLRLITAGKNIDIAPSARMYQLILAKQVSTDIHLIQIFNTIGNIKIFNTV